MKLPTVGAAALADREVSVRTVTDLSVEVVSDSGEGAQKCGQIFGAVSAKMGNGVWTVEIIPAEVEPPPRQPAGASGIRIRLGAREVTNWGDETNVVIAFNEQALLGRHHLHALAPDAIILLESMWATHPDEKIRKQWADAMEELSGFDYTIIEVPMEEQCLTVVDNPRKGKNMFALGILCELFGRDVERAKEQIAHAFRTKKKEITERNHELLDLGVAWAAEHLDIRYEIPTMPEGAPKVVMNGNEAAALGAVAAGLELAAMYPITPATSVSHMLGEVFEKYGGTLHQAEDEIAAAGVAIGASYAGRCAFTITSGPGMALKTEFLGLAVMTEIPLVLVNVQRGGPSTGLPTKVEQSDLLAAIYGQPGDAPKVVMAPGDDRGVLPRHDHGAAHRRDAAHRGDGAHGREPGHRRGAVRRVRSSPRAGRRRRPTSGRCLRAPGPTTGTRRRGSPAASSPARPGASTRSRASRTTSAARSPTTPRRWSARTRRAAASWPRSSRRSFRPRSTATRKVATS